MTFSAWYSVHYVFPTVFSVSYYVLPNMYGNNNILIIDYDTNVFGMKHTKFGIYDGGASKVH